MKIQILTKTTIMLLVASMLFSCKKKNEPVAGQTNSTTTTGGPTIALGSFIWQENGGSVINADSAHWVTGTWGTGIRAYKGYGTSTANFFEINWTPQNNISVGTKTVSFDFVKSNTLYSGVGSQNISITAASTATISGDCNVTVSNATNTSITAITATFSSISKK